MSYTAASIRILPPAEVEALGPWARAAEWSKRYPYPADFLGRLAEACTLSGTDPELAERRYLRGDLTALCPPELVEVHRDLSRAGRGG
jgi:hypothetical protein